jgi:hypothetical protein
MLENPSSLHPTGRMVNEAQSIDLLITKVEISRRFGERAVTEFECFTQRLSEI